MDDDERYNRKLEAGLYTLQVLPQWHGSAASDDIFQPIFG